MLKPISEAEFKKQYDKLDTNQLMDLMYKMYLANYSLTEKISSTNRRLYGSTSEQVSFEQVSLFNEAEVVVDDAKPEEMEEPEIKTVKEKKQAKPKKHRKDHMLDLPTEREDIYPESDTCEICGTKMKEMKPEIIRILEYIPPKYIIKMIYCHKFVCPKCSKEEEKLVIHEVEKDKKPARLIENSLASPELVAHLAYEKYILGVPFDRIAKNLGNKGIPLSKQYICNIVLRVGEDYLKTMTKYMEHDMRKCRVLSLDETTLEVLEHKKNEGRNNCYIWGVLTGKFEPKQMGMFYYNKTREHDFVKTMLGDDYTGIIQTDGYQAYSKYKPAQMKVGCMAHARRKFFDALVSNAKIYAAFKKAGKNKAEQKKVLDQYPRFADIFKMIALMDELFKIEKELKKEQAEPERIKEVRNKEAAKIMDKIYSHNQYLQNHYLQTGKLGKATNYLDNQWEYLMNYLKDGEVSLDNNLIEREGMKTIALSRRNFLFADTERGATISGYYFSIFISAKLNKLKPEKYLSYALKELSTYGLHDDVIERVLPYSGQLPKELKIDHK